MCILSGIATAFHCASMMFSVPSEAGLAARYGYPGDRYAGPNEYACQDRVIRKEGKAAWQHMLKHGVAHRTLPCGTKLLVCRQDDQRCTYVFVVDRGPWGAVDKRGRWHRRTIRSIQAGETWRGVLDILPVAAKELGIRGVHPISAWIVSSQQSNSSRTRGIPVTTSVGAPFQATLSYHGPSLFFGSQHFPDHYFSFISQPFVFYRFFTEFQKKAWPSIDNLV